MAMLPITRVALGVLLLTCSVFIAGTRAASAQQPTQQRTPDEETLRKWLRRFPKADTNGDGVLSAEEANAYRESMKASRSASTSDRVKRTRRGPQPDHADVRYGTHDRNVFDLWLPAKRSESPIPVVVFFHGGGFVAGDKAGFDPSPYLKAGFAAVSANYRFVDGKNVLSPVPMRDACRVIQYLRHHASQWNLDPKRIAVSGSSAGAVIAMWIGYHEDLADPAATDPISRQTTRVTCIAPINGPTNLDARWITREMGGPPHVHGSFPKLFGSRADEEIPPDAYTRMLEASASHWLTADDPPTLLIYNQELNLDDIPLPGSATTGVLIHHPYFGHVLKSKLEKLGIDHEFHPGHDPRKSDLIVRWITEQFASSRSDENKLEAPR